MPLTGEYEPSTHQQTRDQVDRTRAILEQHHGLDVLGVVVTDSQEGDTGYGFHGLDQDLMDEIAAYKIAMTGLPDDAGATDSNNARARLRLCRS